MPRQRTLTGRREREKNRQEQYVRRHRNVTTLHDTYQLIELVDCYKSAMNDCN